MRRLSLSQARRVALHAQGLGKPRSNGKVDIRHMRSVFDSVGVVQLDSVNVAVRAHYMPFFSRLGPYRTGLLEELAYQRNELFEYWGHMASLQPIDHLPLLRWRMDLDRTGYRAGELMENEPGYLEAVLEEVRERGITTAADLEDPGERTGPWWGHGKGKTALEWHHANGKLGARRDANFRLSYDLLERIIPANALRRAAPEGPDAHRQLMMLAAQSLGVATVDDLGDYYRLRPAEFRPAVQALVDEKRLEEVEVEGWDKLAYLVPGTRVPRQASATALVSPFDSLIWYRERTERLFTFEYRIEIYVPEPKRKYGYYVYPFLMGEDLVARVDIKADRKAGALLAKGVYLEPGADPTRTAKALAAELNLMAEWLGMDEVKVGRRGNLAAKVKGFL